MSSNTWSKMMIVLSSTTMVKEILILLFFGLLPLVLNQSHPRPNSSASLSSKNETQPLPASNYLCNSDDKLVNDVWSINNVIYLKVIQYGKNDSKNGGIDSRIFVYDVQHDKFVNVFHYTPVPSSSSSAAAHNSDTSYLRDVLGKALLKANTTLKAPSIVYFGARNVLRSSCQTKWLYIPPSSQFCRYHPIVNNLYRTLAIIDQNGPSNAEVEMYRITYIRDDFSMTTLRPIIQNQFRADQRRDTMEQYITNSLLTLQVSHPIMPPPHQNVRFIFSNNLGLFISWYPSTFANFENDLPVNCAVMMPIKNKPYIKVCSQRYNFVSFIELNQTLYVVLPENQVIVLEHDYIKKQYRIMNNLHIDLDQFEPQNFFQTFFKCNNQLQTFTPVDNRLKHPRYSKSKASFLEKRLTVRSHRDPNSKKSLKTVEFYQKKVKVLRKYRSRYTT